MNRYAFAGILRSSLAVAILALLSVTLLQAQVDTGSITGIVTDSTGAVVGGAKITLTNEGTAAALATTSGSGGEYTFNPVRIGTYKLDVSAQGFKTSSEPHIAVDVNSSVLRNFTLQTGSVSETIEVTTAAPVLQTDESSVGQVVDSRNVNNLPLNGRNFTFLAQLAAGVNTPQADTRGNASTGAFAANGLRPSQNNYMLDGIDNNSDTVDFLNGTNFVVLPPVDAIQEFKVQTSDFSAEFGRSGAAVLNATIKSGTNQFHGTGWEFLRNDKFDGRDYFEQTKGEYRQNQFGFSIGGPVIKDKIFFFGDYEALRKVQGVVSEASVPTLAERNSGFTNLQDLITLQSGTETDALGRTVPSGTVLDPATTRAVTAGAADPISGLVAKTSGYVRDPFGTCAPSTAVFTLGGCGLNLINASRLDPNAIKLLNLYPNPTGSSFQNNFVSSPTGTENRQSFDTRLDINFTQKDQLFYRFSLVDDPQFIPGVFGGVADGGAFQEGNQTALAQQSALAYTHVFSPTAVNVVRAGLNYLHTTRASPEADTLGLPAQFGIQGVPQTALNGGLPQLSINGLSSLGSNGFLPSDEVSSTFQVTDDFTKIYGQHTFKMGFEFQHVKFSTLQPSYSHGEQDFNGDYTDVQGVNSGNTGRADFLLTPTASTVGGIPYVGGPDQSQLSNTYLTDDGKNYYGGYVQDDFKVTPKLTLNLGLRYDFFGLVFEHHGAQANFVPSGPPTGGPVYLLPGLTPASDLSASFVSLLAKDGIELGVTNKYGGGLGTSQKTNFAPRLGLVYSVTPKLVVRVGWGMFYNGFENRGYSPNLGESYPFQFNFNYTPPGGTGDGAHPILFSTTTGAPCAAAGAGPIGNATVETGFACTPLNPAVVNAEGLSLRGIQFNYVTPYSMEGNFTLQYALTPTLSVQAAYANSNARHLEVFPSNNNEEQILPSGSALNLPFPDFGQGASQAETEGTSNYNALQTKVEKRFSSGLNFLADYTWSKTLSDAGDLLNNGSLQGYRAPSVPGFGIRSDYGLASFDIRNVVHLSGGYELPFGKGKRYMNEGGIANQVIGGWSFAWIATLQGGQPMTIPCASGATAGTGCYAMLVPGQSVDTGLHHDSNGLLSWFGNPAAWTQPCVLGPSGPIANDPVGCIPLTGLAALGGHATQVDGPGFRRLDFSTFKNFQLTERFNLQFRAEFFNILNHPNFNSPGFGGNGVVAISGSENFLDKTFGEIGSTRDSPNDPRQIQFALKLLF
jgi:hypothetical protein